MGESKPQLTFKSIGTCQLSNSGQSIRLDIEECTRNTYGCKHIPYISRRQLQEILNGHRKTTSIYILVPAEEADSQEAKE